MNMKCPIQQGLLKSDAEKTVIEWADCLKEECAWWLDDVQLCSMKELVLELRYTQLRLQDLIEKMPPANLFAK